MTTDWPSASPNSCVIWRANVSVAPPGGNATTSRIGRSGQEEGLCACAEIAVASTAATIDHQRKRLRMIRLLVALAGALPAEPESHWITRGRLRRRGRTSQQTLYRRRGRLHIREQPIADIIDGKLTVIDLAVLGATLLGGENLDVLSLRADPFVELLRLGERHDPVVLAVQHEERAFDPLRDAFERELLRPFERGLVVGRADYPAELEDRGGARARISRELGLVAGDPIINVPMHGAERDRRGVAFLEGGNARRVIAAEAVAHDRDAFGIDLRAGDDVVVSGGAGDLVVVTAVDVAQP